MAESEEDVAIYFVIPRGLTDEDCSTDLLQAYQASTDNGLSPEWIAEEKCLELQPIKRDVFIIDPFKGEAFTYLKKFKCVRILGPRCLLTCLLQGEPVPEMPYPVYITAMKGLAITTTGVPKARKEHVQQKIESMGGIYSNVFHAGVTHLIVEEVGSSKYLAAAERNVPVMVGQWVDAVWDAGISENVHATDPQFAKYKCPVFKGLTICVSQMPRKQKDELKKIIESNGGVYSAQLEYEKTSVLVISEPHGEKFRFANKWKLPCVNPAWVTDSSKGDYTQLTDKYKVQSEVRSSTPTEKEGGGFMSMSMCSTIVGDPSRTTVDDTLFDMSTMSVTTPSERSRVNANKAPTPPNHVETLDKLELAEAKRAGPFLDGCKVFLSGFSPTHVEKLRRIINAGGATRFNEITESVSHVIIGNVVSDHVRTLKAHNYSPHVVTVDWLVESIHLGRPAEEEKYTCLEIRKIEPPSPLSKKGLKLLQQIEEAKDASKPVAIPDKSKEQDNDTKQQEQELVQQYLESYTGDNMLGQMSLHAPGEEEKTIDVEEVRNVRQEETQDRDTQETTMGTQETNDVPPIFEGLKFLVIGFDEESAVNIVEFITSLGGNVVSRGFRGIPDYGVVPLEGAQLDCTVNEVVTELWVEDCFEQKNLLAVEYYHQPITYDPDIKPLEGCVIGTSTYTGKERLYIANVAVCLGAVAQDVFARKDNLEREVYGSTHLICPEPSGQKYNAAIKWTLPVVSKDWLLTCLRERQRVSEESYLIGDSKLPAEKSSSSSSSSKSSKCEKKRKNTEDTSGDENDMTKRIAPDKTITNLSLVENKPNNTALKPVNTTVDRKRNLYTTVLASKINSPHDMAPVKNNDGTINQMNTSNASLNSTFHTPKVGHVSTPETPYGCTFEPNPSGETRKAWKRWLEQVPEFEKATPPPPAKKPCGTPLSDIKRQLWSKIDEWSDEMKQKVIAGGTRLEGVGRIPIEELMGSQDTQDEDESVFRGPLSGVVVYVCKKLKDQHETIARIVTELRGEFRWQYDKSVSHVVFQGKQNDATKEFRAAKDDGKLIVSPDWIFACHLEKKRVDESLFPHSYNPKMNLAVVASRTPLHPNMQAKKGRGKGRKCPEIEGTVNETTHLADVTNAGSSDQLVNDNVDNTTPGQSASKSGELFSSDSSKNASSGKSKVILDQLGHLADLINTPTGNRTPGSKKGVSRKLTTDLNDKETSIPIKLEENFTRGVGHPESQSTDCNITWDDIKARDAKEKVKVSAATTTPKFAFTGMENNDRERYKKIVQCLGGTFSDSQALETSVTHLIAVKPGRNEKLLACIAAGKWILHSSYLDACEMLNKFAEEGPYEFGNDGLMMKLQFAPKSVEWSLARAANRWRNKIHIEKKMSGAFQDMCVILHTSPDRATVFKRLLMFGNGRISTARPPYSNPEDATHCLIETNRNTERVDFVSLARRGVPCLSPIFLHNYLISDVPLKVKDHIIPEYRSALELLKK